MPPERRKNWYHFRERRIFREAVRQRIRRTIWYHVQNYPKRQGLRVQCRNKKNFFTAG